MKKFIFTCVLSVIAGHMMAQDDDMYFASDKSAKTQKVSSSASEKYSSQRSGEHQSTHDDYTYNPNDYSGSNRDVDEYNRRHRTGVDSPYDHDSVLISAGEYENYQQMKRWDGYRSTVVVVNDPYYYYPWYDSWYYDPWYYGSWSWRWGYSYYPWYWGYSWRPYYYSSWSWGWHSRPYSSYGRHGWHNPSYVRPHGGGYASSNRRVFTPARTNNVVKGHTNGTGQFNGSRSVFGNNNNNRTNNVSSSSNNMRRSGVTSSNSGSMRSSGGFSSGNGVRSSGGFSGGGGVRSSGGSRGGGRFR